MLKSRLLLERQVNTVARKKIVFVIVEGPSDDEALGVLLEKVFNSSTVFVYITHGDITSKPGTDPSRILAVVGDLVKGYAKSNHLNNTHFQEIIHLTDTDGAFIPDESVVEDPSATKAQYTLTEIRTANVEGILIRNALKSQCLNRLSGAQKIWGIPYQASQYPSPSDRNNGGCRKDGSPRDVILKRSWMVNKDQSPEEGCLESFQGIFLVILHMFSGMRSAVTENVEGDPACKKQALSRL